MLRALRLTLLVAALGCDSTAEPEVSGPTPIPGGEYTYRFQAGNTTYTGRMTVFEGATSERMGGRIDLTAGQTRTGVYFPPNFVAPWNDIPYHVAPGGFTFKMALNAFVGDRLVDQAFHEVILVVDESGTVTCRGREYRTFTAVDAVPATCSVTR